MALPTTKGDWRILDDAGRRDWLRQARDRCFSGGGSLTHERPNVFVLDGELFDDFSGFLCAIGEAVNGPGGYFGATWQGFDDCLFGGFGLEAPCTIRWTSSARSRDRLNHDALLRERAELLAWFETQAAPDRFAVGREPLVATAGRSGHTLFDELVESIKSVATRAIGRPDWVIELRLE